MYCTYNKITRHCFFALLTVLFLGLSASYADTVNKQNLLVNAEQFIDLSNRLTFNEIRSLADSGLFKKIERKDLAYQTPNTNLWIKLDLPANLNKFNKQWILQFGKYFISHLNTLDIYFSVQKGSYKAVHLGEDSCETEKRTINYEITLPSDIDNSEIYIMVNTDVTFYEPVTFWLAEYLFQETLKSSLLVFILFGILIAMVLYNFAIYLVLKDRTYLYYVLFMGNISLWQFFSLGYVKLILDMSYSTEVYLLYFFSKIAALFSILFVVNFLEIRQYLKKAYYLYCVFFITFICSMVLGLFGLYAAADTIDSAAGILLTLFNLIVTAVRFRQGEASAKLVLSAWIIMGFFTIIYFMRSLMFLENTPVTVYGIVIGASVEAILLSIALAYKMRSLKQETGKLKTLTEKDALTGLLNRRFLNQKLPQLIEYSIKHNNFMCLLMIDIDNFKKFNDNYGHQQGDNMLRLVAGSISSSIRSNDYACRYGGEEFTVIIDENDMGKAQLIAQRIVNMVNSTTLDIEGEDVSTSVSIGLAQLSISDTAATLIHRADQALYRAKKEGKNRVVIET